MLNELQIDLIKQERDIVKAALKACRAECQKRGITSAEFAKMCGLSRVQLTVYTGATPDTQPDLIETNRHHNPATKEDYETMHDYMDRRKD